LSNPFWGLSLSNTYFGFGTCVRTMAWKFVLLGMCLMFPSAQAHEATCGKEDVACQNAVASRTLLATQKSMSKSLKGQSEDEDVIAKWGWCDNRGLSDCRDCHWKAKVTITTMTFKNTFHRMGKGSTIRIRGAGVCMEKGYNDNVNKQSTGKRVPVKSGKRFLIFNDRPFKCVGKYDWTKTLFQNEIDNVNGMHTDIEVVKRNGLSSISISCHGAIEDHKKGCEGKMDCYVKCQKGIKLYYTWEKIAGHQLYGHTKNSYFRDCEWRVCGSNCPGSR